MFCCKHTGRPKSICPPGAYSGDILSFFSLGLFQKKTPQGGRNVGHFGHGHFGLGRFGPDISVTDVSATENAKGGRFGQNHKLQVGVCACINV